MVRLREIDARETPQTVEDKDAILVDVRSDEEWRIAHIPGALHIPMSQVEQRLPELAPDRSRPIITFCATGNRSLRILPTVDALGYEDSVSMAGGIVAWRELGFPVESDSALDEEQRNRYSRHLLIPEVGEQGQQPGSGGSESWTTTSSTSRTSSARCSTRPLSSVSARPARPGRRSRSSIPTSTS
jgi:rhodanese-related sulfurtransferase